MFNLEKAKNDLEEKRIEIHLIRLKVLQEMFLVKTAVGLRLIEEWAFIHDYEFGTSLTKVLDKLNESEMMATMRRPHFIPKTESGQIWVWENYDIKTYNQTTLHNIIAKEMEEWTVGIIETIYEELEEKGLI